MALYDGKSLFLFSVECDGKTVVVAARDILEAVKLSGFYGRDPKTIDIEALGSSQEHEPRIVSGEKTDE